MPPFAEKREVQFITVYIVAMIFLGISRETTSYIFPDAGVKIFNVINFYFVSATALMVAIAWLAQSRSIPSVPRVPPLWAVIMNFFIFFPIFYILLNLLFTGSFNVPIPTLANAVIETAVSFNENFIAFILLPTLLPWGKGTGTIASGKILKIREYTLQYNIPTLDRIKYGMPSIGIITFLHVGSYSQNVSNTSEFYTVLGIAFVMFTIMYFIKETFSFGASEAAHDAWNLSLISIRGSVI